MAGSSCVTLYRTEDATISMQFLARQAARTLAADFTAGTLRLVMKTYPDGDTKLEITPSFAVANCVLSITDADDGMAELFIPSGFWGGMKQRRFSVQAFYDTTANGTQRLGEQTIDLTE